MGDYWLQDAIERPGRVRRYVRRLFGDKAFTKDGNLKLSYLRKARRIAEEHGNTSLVKAIDLAIRLKTKIGKGRKRKKKGKRRKKKRR